MTDQQLQAWVEEISWRCFGRKFIHQARFNSRLRSTGGRYFTQSHDIEISRLQYDMYGAEEVEKIIKHELCHYHLHLQGRGYKHRDAEFKELLQRVGGSRYCKATGTRRVESYKYKLICRSCGMEYLRKRKIDPRKYACGSCRGRLKLVSLVDV